MTRTIPTMAPVSLQVHMGYLRARDGWKFPPLEPQETVQKVAIRLPLHSLLRSPAHTPSVRTLLLPLLATPTRTRDLPLYW